MAQFGYSKQEINLEKLWVHCSSEIHAGHAVQPGALRFECAQGHGGVLLRDVRLDAITSVRDLMVLMAMSDMSDLKVECFLCGITTGKVVFKCQYGTDSSGSVCKNTSCRWLPQVFPSEGLTCFLSGQATTDRHMFRFDRCGHCACHEELEDRIYSALDEGLAGGSGGAEGVRFLPDAEVGQLAVACPCGRPGAFLHDVEHVKAAVGTETFNEEVASVLATARLS